MIDKEELETLIPHRGAMMLLSRVIKYDLNINDIEAQYDITPECLFYDDEAEGVPSWVGFEFIAQAISAFIGIRDREKGMPPKEGLILGVSHIKFDLPFFAKNSIITIKTREIDNVDPIFIFDGQILVDSKEVLTGKLTVMEVYDGIKSSRNGIN